MNKPKINCHWYSKNEYRCRHECEVLDPMPCIISGKCTFYETTEQYNVRQDKFNSRGVVPTEKGNIV